MRIVCEFWQLKTREEADVCSEFNGKGDKCDRGCTGVRFDRLWDRAREILKIRNFIPIFEKIDIKIAAIGR